MTLIPTESSRVWTLFSHLLKFYRKFSLKWKVNQLAGGVARAVGSLGVKCGKDLRQTSILASVVVLRLAYTFDSLSGHSRTR